MRWLLLCRLKNICVSAVKPILSLAVSILAINTGIASDKWFCTTPSLSWIIQVGLRIWFLLYVTRRLAVRLWPASARNSSWSSKEKAWGRLNFCLSSFYKPNKFYCRNHEIVNGCGSPGHWPLFCLTWRRAAIAVLIKAKKRNSGIGRFCTVTPVMII
jgi:hypothetical protein